MLVGCSGPTLLGALTIGRGSAQSGGGGGGGHRSQIILPNRPKYTKTAKKRRLCAHFGLLIAGNAVFCSKVLNKIHMLTIRFSEEHMNFKTHYLSHCRVILKVS